MSQISINAKKEENERLKEYITMEQEKLDEAQKFLQEDKEKFDKLMDDSDKVAKHTADEVKSKARERQDLIRQIEELQQKIAQKDNMAKKVEDDLVEYKKLKHFLDVLAIQAGKKKYNPKQNIYSSNTDLHVNTGKNTASTMGDRKG